MKPERWRQVDQLFQAALERPSEDRSAFISTACGGDDSLRCEVEALLAADEEAGSLIETPAYAVAAPLIAGGDGPTLLGKTIGHYQIISLVGKGGMGEVYRARDTKLDRAVALKILPEAMSADGERMRRFSREAKAASALNHPNVAHIYEIGEAEGVNFIAMEYVEGQTLAARINGQPLEINEIIDIGSQIADALDEAHRKRITHRDLKPANVMLNERGQVKVLDFGLAKIAPPTGQAVVSDISTMAKTASGVVMGTVPYMSPEQALGREVDHRSDLFSLGVALYEMATGRMPFAGSSPSEILDRILHAQPEAMARFNYDVPPELERIVRKCLEKEPERRYQSARELLVDLKNYQRDSQPRAMTATQVATPSRSRRRLLTAFAVALLALGGLALYLLLSRAQPKGEAINSMAVLPFKPLVAESHDEALELGMADTLITRLSGIRQLVVRPVSAVRKYTSAEQSAVAAGKEQQVDAVLESHFQRSGDRIRVTARLVRVVDGSTVWAGKFDERFTDIFAVQDGISEQVVGALALQLTSAERTLLAKRGTENAEAYLLYQKGRFFQSKRTLESFTKSAEYFNQAIEKDPNFALAYVGLADAYPGSVYGPPLNQDSILKRKTALKRALELDETLPEIHVTIANDFFGEWNLAESNREFQRALELNPNYAPAHQGYGRRNLLLMGRLDEALAHLKRAQELDPLSLIINSDIGTFYFFTGQYDKAIEQQRKTLEMEQNFYPAHRYLARALEMKGLFQEAIAEYQKARQLNENPLLLAQIGRVYAVSGRKAEALKIIEQLKEISRNSYVSPHSLAIVYLGLGEKDQAFQWLERAFRERVLDLSHLTVDPYFAGLRSDQRFVDLVQRVGIAP